MLEMLIIIGAKYLIIVPVAATLAYLLYIPREQKQKLAFLTLISLPLVYLLARLAGLFYSHPQPFVEWGVEPLIPHAIDNAFPSDHTALAATLAAIVGISSRYLGLGLFLVAAIIGLSRVVLGLHNALDIGASLMLAYGAVWLTHALINRFTTR